VDLSRGSRRREPGCEVEFVTGIYEEHGAALRAYVLRLTGDAAKAEDVVQETVLRAWKSAGRLGADSRPQRPGRYTVAARLVIDDRRASRVRPQEVTEELLETIPVGDELDRAVDAWQLGAALGMLTPAHREVLVETYYRGHSVSEASSALGIPVGTVKSRVYYGLRALRAILEEQGWTT